MRGVYADGLCKAHRDRRDYVEGRLEPMVVTDERVERAWAAVREHRARAMDFADLLPEHPDILA